MIIKLGEWLPDLPYINHPGLIDIENMVPTVSGSYVSVRSNVEYQDMPSGTTTLLGGISTISGTTVEDFCGDSGDLYRLTWNTGPATITAANASKSANAYATTAFWDFTQYGDIVIAVCGGTSSSVTPQAITIGSANFADLSGSPPKAKTVTTLKEFVVMGHTYDATDGERGGRIRWSGYADHTSWTVSPTTQADFQDLNSVHGEVQRICGGDDVIIVTANSVFYMTYVGPPTIMQFTEIAPGRARGTSYPESVIRDGNTVYFWSDVGPMSVSIDGTVRILGEGKCSEYLRKTASEMVTLSPWAFKDAIYNAICWQIGTTFTIYYLPSFDRFTKVKDSTNPNSGAIWDSKLVLSSPGNFIDAPLYKKDSDLAIFSRSGINGTQVMKWKTGGRQLFERSRALFKELRLLGNSLGSDKIIQTYALALNDPPQIQGDHVDDGDFTVLTFAAATGQAYQGLIEGRYHFFYGTINDNGVDSNMSFYLDALEITEAAPSGRY